MKITTKLKQSGSIVIYDPNDDSEFSNISLVAEVGARDGPRVFTLMASHGGRVQSMTPTELEFILKFGRRLLKDWRAAELRLSKNSAHFTKDI